MSGFLPWNRVSHRLRNAECYWLSTTRPDGRPHSMPVWGLWDDESLWFGTGLESVKARNLAHLPYAVMHLESADDVVVLEGLGERVLDSTAGSPISSASPRSTRPRSRRSPMPRISRRAREEHCSSFALASCRRGSRVPSRKPSPLEAAA